MYTAETATRRYRPDLRYRRRSPNTQQNKAREEVNPGGPSDVSRDDTSLQKAQERRAATMTRDHRLHHRRQAPSATKVVTVNVDVVNTVDSNGNLVGQETKTAGPESASTPGAAVDSPPEAAAAGASAAVDAAIAVSLPQVPAVPPFPTNALPVVPSVPGFPSGFSVPAYPFTAIPSAQVAEVSTGLATPSSAPSSSSVVSTPVPAAASPASNSTATATPSLSSATFLGSSITAPPSDSPSPLAAAVSSGSSSDSNSEVVTSLQEFRSDLDFTNTASPTQYGGAGGPAPPAAQSSAAADDSSADTITPLAPPQVVGSVVGSLAGAALILAVILLLLRRHKRKRKGALQLTNDETTDRAPPMSQDTTRNNLIPAAFLNRFSSMSRSTVETNTSAGERSFQRVSGRKLPSAFSEGMTSEQFSRGGAGPMSGSTFYSDDQGTYGSPAMSKDIGKEGGSSPVVPGAMSFRPSPARTPIIRHPDDDRNPFADPAPISKERLHLSPPQSPNPEKPLSTLGRSLQSADGSRSSKFTENV